MPEKRTLERARRKARQGKSASTVAGEFVREELDEIRKGKHGARNAKQAIAIGLSKARRAGVPLAGKGKRTKKRPSASHIHDTGQIARCFATNPKIISSPWRSRPRLFLGYHAPP